MLGQLRYVVDVEGLVADGARESRGHAAGEISVVIPRFNVCFGVGILLAAVEQPWRWRKCKL